MDQLEGKVAVVTGAGSGIGAGMARAFAGAGMSVVVADLDEAGMAATVADVEALGQQAIAVPTNTAELEQVEALAAAAKERFGGVHVACFNAGVGIPTPTDRIDLADWRWIIDVDLWGPINGVKVFLPIMEEQGEGHLNATSSLAGLIASPMMGAYNVAKHGVVALMATLSRDLRVRRSPIKASCLCPGPINTPIGQNSARRRPRPADRPKTDRTKARNVADSVTEMLKTGMQPDEVGELVLDAVRTDRFWVFTHPDYLRIVRRQLDASEADGSLTKA